MVEGAGCSPSVKIPNGRALLYLDHTHSNKLNVKKYFMKALKLHKKVNTFSENESDLMIHSLEMGWD